MKDITLINMNMLYIRHFDFVEREFHIPLGPLYLTRALEESGYSVDFRDYQLNQYENPFCEESILSFVSEPAKIIGISLMANLLPFVLLALKAVKDRYPDRTTVLGGVGSKSVERTILERFPWIDIIAAGEYETSAPLLLEALTNGKELDHVPGIFYRKDRTVRANPRAGRIENPDEISFPAFHHIDMAKYNGYGVIASRGCPYQCTFCSVAPVWDRKSYSRSAENIIEEMRLVHEKTGTQLFLFQDEFFLSSKRRIVEFCRLLDKSGLPVEWKTFGRVDLTDTETMREMASSGCIEIRYGIESGSPKILERTKKGFTPEEAVTVISEATRIFPRVDTFYIWGFPFETMKDFYQSVFQMISFRTMGARVLPNILCFLPQTDIYRSYREKEKFSFCPDLFPEYMVTGHEVCRGIRVSVTEQHREIFDFIAGNSDIFPGFFHYRLEENILPKLKIMEEFGFYPGDEAYINETESCGAHSPRVEKHRKSS